MTSQNESEHARRRIARFHEYFTRHGDPRERRRCAAASLLTGGCYPPGRLGGLFLAGGEPIER